MNKIVKRGEIWLVDFGKSDKSNEGRYMEVSNIKKNGYKLIRQEKLSIHKDGQLQSYKNFPE